MQYNTRLQRRWRFVLEVGVAALAGAIVTAAYNSKARVAGLLARLRQRPPSARATYDAAELAGLPAPVALYFRTVLRDGQPIIRHAWLTQRGEFLVRAEPPVWRPFSATEAMTVGGFVWNARIRVLPGVAIHVCDSFVAGAGSMRASAMGVFPLMHVEGTPEIATGALLRYLAEAVWMPTALLPSQGMTWIALDDASARATITGGATTVSLDFHFGADGLVERVCTDARPREAGGEFVRTPWQGRFGQYEDVQGIRIPLRGDVEWLLPEGPQPYWRGSVTAAAFEYEVQGS
ncbi:MAG TPA: DUF6544 family protein [Thermoanaerobaculia bacterium]|nr:DUF6544 family protein [Thermoanaerobaculia bacterium]